MLISARPSFPASFGRSQLAAIRRCGMFPALVLAAWTWFAPKDKPQDIDEERIRKATVSLSVEHVLGWAYEGNIWRRGKAEAAAIGAEGFPDRGNVRAVCLGREGGYLVFFTLRSFVDPFYPNPSIQGVAEPPVDPEGRPVNPAGKEIGDSLAMRDARLIRYGEMQLGRYEDVGGGKFRVAGKAEVVTVFDPEAPMTSKWFTPEETYRGGKFKRPHKDVSVEEHFRRKESGESGAALFRFVGKHDVALIYVPETAFGEGAEARISTLDIAQPSAAVDLCLQQSRSLFGFDFLLMGQETLDTISGYRPPKKGGEFPGFEKLAGILGLAMDPQTLAMIKAVDTALNRVIPPPKTIGDIRQVWIFWKTIRPDVLAKIGGDMAQVLQNRLAGSRD